MKVLFYTPSFTERRGGVEKRFCQLANELAQRGDSVRVLTARDRRNPRPMFPLHADVSVHFAKVEKQCVRPLVNEFRPDIVISVNGRKTAHFIGQLSDVSPHVVITEQLSPDDMARMTGTREKRLANLAAADRIHVLMPGYRSSLPGELAARCVVIPNHCEVTPDRADVRGARLSSGQRRHIVYVARLDRRQKRQQLLIEAFARLRDRFPDWDVWLWGDHHDRRTLLGMRLLAWRRRVADRVRFAGPTDDVTSELLQSHLLAFPSAYEGFPSALLQGMACGLPCVGFAGCAGVNELILDGVTGLLVPGHDDVPTLAEAMARLMADPGMRESFGRAGQNAARAYAYAPFRDGWLGLLDGLQLDRTNGVPPVSRSPGPRSETRR